MTTKPARRILILAEGKFSQIKSKTASVTIAYAREEVVAVVDSTKAGMTAHDVLGYGGAIPILRTLEEGYALNPTHLLIGIAPTGGKLPAEWRAWISSAIRQRLHIINGLHTLLGNDEEFRGLAQSHGVQLIDLRSIPPEAKVVAKGTWRTRKAKTILTVGTDCNIGKMTTLMEVHKDLVRRGLKADFVATGQTGILIRGRGIAVDAIIGDYVAGCIEREIDRSAAEGYDFILVEGQGALTHMGYSGVTFGLMHGTMPDAMILVHQPTRLKDDYGLSLPDLNRVIRFHEEAIRFFRETKIVAIGLNSVGLTDVESMAAAERIERETGLPTIDAFRFEPNNITDAVLQYFNLLQPV
ncbi:MAG: DUF1611 domain-containing protein [Ignavibacteria bacterium]|nr:DUF1611 domain-containing protein [Ignavibacteria bacterium]